MQCVHCKKIIVDDAKFCSYCGVELAVCKGCGKRNPEEAAFCMYCGVMLLIRTDQRQEPAGQETPPAVPNHPGTTVGISPKAPDAQEKNAADEYDAVIGKVCPYCQVPIKSKEAIVVCSDCKMAHHEECWKDNANKCTTFGCRGINSKLRKQEKTSAKNAVLGRVTFSEDEVLEFLAHARDLLRDRNFVEAYVWYSLAAKGGSDDAKQTIPKLLSKMSYEQILHANNLLDDYIQNGL